LLLNGLGSYPFVPLGSENPYQDELDNDELGFGAISGSKIDSIRMIIAGQYLEESDSARFAKEMSVFISHLPSNEFLYQRTIQYLLANDLLDKAYPTILTQLKELKDTNISKNKMIGKSYMQLKNYDSAAFFLEMGLSLLPNDTTLLLDAGFVHMELEDYVKAERDFTRVIDLFPSKKDAYHQRGVSRFELKKYAGAVEDMTQVINLSDAPQALSYLIRGYANFGLKDKDSYCNDWQNAADLGLPRAQELLRQFCSN
jgi:tetratricopeptide (TPR) repeat protein